MTQTWRVWLLAIPLAALASEPLGLFEQRFSTINFERGKWTRTMEPPCRVYVAQEAGAMVDVVRQGANTLVSFRSGKGLKVTICSDTAAFDEGFEATGPTPAMSQSKR